jgi:hypothetical protein
MVRGAHRPYLVINDGDMNCTSLSPLQQGFGQTNTQTTWHVPSGSTIPINTHGLEILALADGVLKILGL